jgi:hypothetical protein
VDGGGKYEFNKTVLIKYMKTVPLWEFRILVRFGRSVALPNYSTNPPDYHLCRAALRHEHHREQPGMFGYEMDLAEIAQDGVRPCDKQTAMTA